MHRIRYCSGNSASLAPGGGAGGVVLMVNRGLRLLASHVDRLHRRAGHVVDVGLGFGVHCWNVVVDGVKKYYLSRYIYVIIHPSSSLIDK